MSEIKEKSEKTESKLPFKNFLEKKLIKVKPLPAGTRWSALTADRLDPNAPFMHDGTKKSLPIPASKQNAKLYVKILDNNTKYNTSRGLLTEQEFFEKELGQDLTFNMSNDFWNNFRIHLPKSGTDLDLSDPIHYLRYKLAQKLTRHIAPNKASMNNRATYWYYLEEADAYVDEELEKMKVQDSANEEWAKIKNNDIKLRDILRVAGKKVPATVKEGFYQAEVNKLKNEKPNEFLSIINDPYFKAKSFIKNAISKGLITKQGGNGYMLVGNDIDVFKTESDLINYLEDPENSVIKTRIENQLDRAK